MGSELKHVARLAEEMIVRKVHSRAVRDVRKRRAREWMDEAFRRFRRAGWILASLLATLVLVSILAGGIGFLTWLVALPTVMLLAFLSLFWPTRSAAANHAAATGKASAPLDRVALRAADGLADRWQELPPESLGAANKVIAHLTELAPQLPGLAGDPIADGEARRLLCDHLPRLVDTYLELPARDRATRSESSRRFAEGMDLMAGELENLLENCCRHRRVGFETHSRFLESRYKDPLTPPRVTGGSGS